jgi:hypothetical protein
MVGLVEFEAELKREAKEEVRGIEEWVCGLRLAGERKVESGLGGRKTGTKHEREDSGVVFNDECDDAYIHDPGELCEVVKWEPVVESGAEVKEVRQSGG